MTNTNKIDMIRDYIDDRTVAVQGAMLHQDEIIEELGDDNSVKARCQRARAYREKEECEIILKELASMAKKIGEIMRT